ncbi:MAG: hypothetical protein EB059_09970 [Alphaproteobacteria bacterium]|nr:hypothetical protein [Alphaproteobacteria bacterium]
MLCTWFSIAALFVAGIAYKQTHPHISTPAAAEKSAPITTDDLIKKIAQLNIQIDTLSASVEQETSTADHHAEKLRKDCQQLRTKVVVIETTINSGKLSPAMLPMADTTLQRIKASTEKALKAAQERARTNASPITPTTPKLQGLPSPPPRNSPN